MRSLILASGSPRRRELLAALGVAFDVVPSRADESIPPQLGRAAALEGVALRKAREVAARERSGAWVLAADTAVVVADRIFGKPRDRADARKMLRALSGRSHEVITGVCLIGIRYERTLSAVTEVAFRDLSNSQIEWYTSLAEPYDKAGAYAIQGRGAFMVASIRGSYTNVVGLPMAETVDLLEDAGFVPWFIASDREVAGA